MSKMDEFLAAIAPALTTSSLRVATRALWSMRKGLGGGQPTTENLFVWLKQRIAVDRVKASTLQLERVYCNRFFNWCIDMGYLERNPLKPIPTVPVRVVTKLSITEEQRDSLLRSGEGTFWPAVILVAWFTGARSVDIVDLRWGNVSFETGVLTFTPRKTEKTGREVKLPMHPRLMALLELVHMAQEDRRADALIFPEAKVIHQRDDGSFQRQFRALCVKAGLPSGITFHCFRHTRARRMLYGEHKVTPLVAADVLGISNLNTLRRYNETAMEDKKKAMGL